MYHPSGNFLVNIKLTRILNFHFTNISSLNSSSVVRPVSVSTQRNGKIRSIALYISSHGTCVLNISISVHCQVSLSYTRQLFVMTVAMETVTNDHVAMRLLPVAVLPWRLLPWNLLPVTMLCNTLNSNIVARSLYECIFQSRDHARH